MTYYSPWGREIKTDKHPKTASCLTAKLLFWLNGEEQLWTKSRAFFQGSSDLCWKMWHHLLICISLSGISKQAPWGPKLCCSLPIPHSPPFTPPTPHPKVSLWWVEEKGSWSIRHSICFRKGNPLFWEVTKNLESLNLKYCLNFYVSYKIILN